MRIKTSGFKYTSRCSDFSISSAILGSHAKVSITAGTNRKSISVLFASSSWDNLVPPGDIKRKGKPSCSRFSLIKV